MKYLGVLIGLIVFWVISFCFSSLIVYGICWAFGFSFTWKLAIGIWLILTVLKNVLSSNK